MLGMRGRVMALYGMIFRAGPALGAVLMGSLSERFGLRLPLAVGAVVSCALLGDDPVQANAQIAARSKTAPAPAANRRSAPAERERVSRGRTCSASASATAPAPSPAPGRRRLAVTGTSARRGPARPVTASTATTRCPRCPRRGHAHSRLGPARRGRRPGARSPWRRHRRAARSRLARLSVDDRGLRQPRRRLGRRGLRAAPDGARGAPAGRRPSELARLERWAAPMSSASRRSTGPAAARSTRCAPATARRIDRPGQVFSRIHVEDLAGVLRASMARPRPGAVYNVCDDEPAEPADVSPTRPSCSASRRRRSNRSTRRSCRRWRKAFGPTTSGSRNALIKKELGVALRYPDYRAGLAAILAPRSG